MKNQYICRDRDCDVLHLPGAASHHDPPICLAHCSHHDKAQYSPSPPPLA